jgi:lysophospholipase L1-like esterase
MSIILTKDVRIAGSVVAAGPSVLTYAAELEADLVARRVAIYSSAPSVVDPVTPSADYAAAVVGAGGSTSARGMILFGDSFQFLSWNIDSTQNKLSSRGIAPVANMLLGNPLKPKINAGLNGDKTSDMLARMAVDVLPYIEPGDVVFVTGGINDIANNVLPTVTIANMQAICDALVLSGAIVSLGTVCPSILRITDSTTNNAIGTINRGYRQIAINTQNVYLSDDHVAMLDTADIYAQNISTYSADDLHPNTLGAMAIGRTRAASLAGLGLKKWPLVSSNQDYKGIVYNPLAIGSNANGVNGAVIGTGVTGDFCPNGWSATRTGTLAAVLSKVARTDGQAGEWVRAAITGGAARDVMRWSWTLTTSGVNWAASTAYPISRVRAPTVANGFVYQVVQAGTTGATQPTWPTVAGQLVTDGTVIWACRDLPIAGDQVEASAEFLLSGWTGTAAVQAYINWQDAGAAVIFQQSCNFLFTGDTLPNYTPPSGVLYMPPVTLPAGTVTGTLFVECSTTAGATGNFDLCNVSARLTNR